MHFACSGPEWRQGLGCVNRGAELKNSQPLSRFLADLRQQAKALIRINRCHVERLPAGAEERAGGRANLLAECDLDWLTAREAGRKHPPDDGRSAGR